jgi:halogenation protein CepH
MRSVEHGSGEQSDVVIIGGGPAGSCAAGLLARSGIRVTLLEGVAFPREHIGESLLAMSMRYLRQWGVDDVIADSGFVKKSGAIFKWGGAKEEMRLGMPYPGYAYQVARDRFDDLLLRRAEEAGVRVRRKCWARRLFCDAYGHVNGVLVQDGTDVELLSARYVVDASGLFQFVPKALGLPVVDDGWKRAAVGAYYASADRVPGAACDDIITEAADNSWLWFIPLSDEITSVGMVTDADLVEHRDPQASIEGAVQQTDLIRRLLKPSRVSRKGRLLRYTNHVVGAPLWDRGYVLVGDSAMFVDPLFSTGVHGALLSASHAAAALGSVLSGTVPEAEAARWYDEEMRLHYHRVDETVKVLYGVHPGRGEFWKRRDLRDLGADGADLICERLGAVGARFFRHAHQDGVLQMPETLTSRLAGFHVDISVARCPDSAVPRLAPEVQRTTGLVLHEGALAQGIVLRHLRNRTVRPSYPDGSLMSRIVRAVDGSTTAGGIPEQLRLTEAERSTCAAALGSLQQAGLITTG